MASSSCFPILAVFLLLSTATATATSNHHHHHTAGGGAVSPFCTTATTAPDDKAICTQLVNRAKTWAEAMTNAIKGVIGIANAAKPRVVDGLGAMLPSGLSAVAKEETVSTCREMFDDYVYHLEQCIGFVTNDPTSSLETYFSTPDFTFCKVALDDEQLSLPEINHFNDQTMKMANILLSILEKKPQA